MLRFWGVVRWYEKPTDFAHFWSTVSEGGRARNSAGTDSSGYMLSLSNTTERMSGRETAKPSSRRSFMESYSIALIAFVIRRLCPPCAAYSFTLASTHTSTDSEATARGASLFTLRHFQRLIDDLDSSSTDSRYRSDPGTGPVWFARRPGLSFSHFRSASLRC